MCRAMLLFCRVNREGLMGKRIFGLRPRGSEEVIHMEF